MVGRLFRRCVCHLVTENEKYNPVQCFIFYFQPFPYVLLLHADKYADFIEANRTEDPVERLKGLKRMVSYYDTSCYLK